MARNIIAIYADLPSARQVAQELLQIGVPRTRVRLVVRNAVERYQQLATLSDWKRMDNAAGGAGAGAVSGAVAGVVLALILALIPGVGWFIGEGPVATLVVLVVAGAGVGAVLGVLRGALSIADVPEREAAHHTHEGNVLLAVQVPEEDANRVANLMERHAPLDMDRSAKAWPQDRDWVDDAIMPGEEPEPEPPVVEVLPKTRPNARPPRGAPQVLTFPTTQREGAGPNPAENRPPSGAPTPPPARTAPVDDAPEYYRSHFNSRFPGEDWSAYRRAYALGGELARREERGGRHRTWREIETEARKAWSREPHELPFERARRAIQHAYEEELRPGTLGTPIR